MKNESKINLSDMKNESKINLSDMKNESDKNRPAHHRRKNRPKVRIDGGCITRQCIIFKYLIQRSNH